MSAITDYYTPKTAPGYRPKQRISSVHESDNRFGLRICDKSKVMYSPVKVISGEEWDAKRSR